VKPFQPPEEEVYVPEESPLVQDEQPRRITEWLMRELRRISNAISTVSRAMVDKSGVGHEHDHDDLTNVTANQHHNQVHAWDGTDHSGMPATFPPDIHTHIEEDITDLDKYTQAEVDAIEAGLQDEIDGKQPVENGFVDRADSTISFTDGTRTFEIAPAVTEYTFFSEGNSYTKSAAESVAITDTEGLWFFYYDGTGTLIATQAFTETIITTYAFVALVYWDATNNTGITLAEERHGNAMDSITHLYNHSTTGTRYGSGLQVADVDADGSGNDASAAQISVGSGVIWDEDIKIDIASDAAPANIPFLYRDGASGNWRKVAATDYIVHPTGTGRAAYNEWTGAVWQLTEVGNNNYCLVHLYATNDISDGYFLIAGQEEYSTISAARANAGIELLALELDGLPVVEFKSVASFIIQTATAYSNAVKSRVRVTDDGADFIDWRFIDVGAILNVAGATSKWVDGTVAGTIHYSGGNVGIGTNTPTHTLHTIAPSTMLEQTGAADTSHRLKNLTAEWRVGVNTGGDFYAYDATGKTPFTIELGAGDKALYVSANGEIGINGTPSGSGRALEVFSPNGSDPTQMVLQVGTSLSNCRYRFQYRDSGGVQEFSLLANTAQQAIRFRDETSGVNLFDIMAKDAVTPGRIRLPAEDAWTDVADGSMSNSWVNFNTATAQIRYRKDPSGRVFMEGLAKNGVINTTAFTIPANYRPDMNQYCVGISNTGAARFDVTTAGLVIIRVSAPTFMSVKADWVAAA
jgi:hypothetical protein